MPEMRREPSDGPTTRDLLCNAAAGAAAGESRPFFQLKFYISMLLSGFRTISPCIVPALFSLIFLRLERISKFCRAPEQNSFRMPFVFPWSYFCGRILVRFNRFSFQVMSPVHQCLFVVGLRVSRSLFSTLIPCTERI